MNRLPATHAQSSRAHTQPHTQIFPCKGPNPWPRLKRGQTLHSLPSTRILCLWGWEVKGGVSQIPGPPPLHTLKPSLGRGRGPAPTLRAEFWGGPESRGLTQSRNNGTWEGGRAPQVCVPILLSFPPLQEQSLGREGEGSASGESKDGGKSRPCFANPFHLPKAFPSKIVLHPHFPAASLPLHAEAGFGGVCNLQTGAAALLQTEEGRSLASRRGVCDARVAGRARPGPAWPPPLGPFLQATLGFLPSFR